MLRILRFSPDGTLFAKETAFVVSLQSSQLHIIIIMRLQRFALPAILACALASSVALATPYEIGNSSSVSANTGDGLIINTSLVSGLSNVAFNLNDGQSTTFDFFKIWTPETDVGKDDKNPVAISATLDFDNPLDTGANVSGVTFGGSFLFGFYQWGEVVWNAPVIVSSGGISFKVSLSNETFNGGLFGLNEGECNGAIVKATVTQLCTEVPSRVPDSGSTVAFLGLALASVGIISRRRRA